MGVYSNNRTMLREGSYNEAAKSYKDNILECLIEARKTDMAVFETVIDNDFYHAYNEAGVIYVTEDEANSTDGKSKEGVISKIKDLITKAIETIKSFFAKFIEKMEEVTKKDERLYKKYAAAVQKNGVGKVVKTKCVAFTKQIETDLTSFGSAWILNDINSAIAESNNEYQNIDKVNDTFKKCLDGVKAKTDEVENMYKTYSETSKEALDYTVTAQDVNALLMSMKGSKSKNMDCIRTSNKATIQQLEAIKKSSALTKNLVGEDKDLLAYYSALESFISKAISATTTYNSLLLKCESKIYSVERSLFVALGKQCTEKNAESSEKVKEEAYFLSMLSDTYMEEAFSF